MHNEPLVTQTIDDGMTGKPTQVRAIKQPLILQRPSALKQFATPTNAEHWVCTPQQLHQELENADDAKHAQGSRKCSKTSP